MGGKLSESSFHRLYPFWQRRIDRLSQSFRVGLGAVQL
jgi:hypothetical protein